MQELESQIDIPLAEEFKSHAPNVVVSGQSKRSTITLLTLVMGVICLETELTYEGERHGSIFSQFFIGWEGASSVRPSCIGQAQAGKQK